MKRAVIYARVSTQRQADDGVSMDSQIDQCRVKARELGVDVAEVFRDDGVSGRTDNRPGFQAALAYCAANPISHFICWSTSRFGRNLQEALKNVNQLREWGTRPAYVHQDIDIDTDQGWMLAVMTGMMDEMHSRNVAKDTLRSMISASKDGFWVGGRAPFGYKPVPVGKRHKLVPDDTNAEIVKLMFRLTLEEGMGAQAIALRLNAENLTRAGKPWGKTSVAAILKNQSYMGVRLFNQTNKKTREAKPEEEVVRVDSHPALVSKEEFERAQIMMEERMPHQQGGTPKSTFAFTGLLRCGICGGQLQMTNGTGRGKRLYSYYSCLAHRAGQPRCLFKNIPAEAFDDWMLGEILDKVMTADTVKKVIEEIQANSHNWAEERALQRKSLVKDMREKESRRKNLFELLETQGKNTPNLADVSSRLRDLSEGIEAIQRQLTVLEIRQAPDYSQMNFDPDIAAEMMHEVIRSCPDKKQLRALLGTFIDKITVDTTRAIVEYREEALLRSPNPTVHSEIRWLPVGTPLRTGRVVLELPLAWREIKAAA